MLDKIIAFFIAVYLFIAGIPYGNEPVKVEFEYEISPQVTVYEPGDEVYIEITVTNVGRPFMGTKPLKFCFHEGIYQVIDGKKVYCDAPPEVITHDYPVSTIIKHGYTDKIDYSFYIEDDAVPGMYSLEVSCGGCSHLSTHFLCFIGILIVGCKRK